jgi:hypothetical protein
MNGLAVDTLAPLFGVDGTVAVKCLALSFLKPFVSETEVGAGAEVAVKALHIVTLFAQGAIFILLSVERAEVRLFNAHVLKIEIGDDRLLVKPFGKQPDRFCIFEYIYSSNHLM